MNVGQITLDNFEQFQTEAIRLGIRFEDRNFIYDENPEAPGLMAWLLTYNGKLLISSSAYQSHFITFTVLV